MRRFDHYAETQRWIWRKVKELQAEYDLGEAIDVIVDALDLYEEHLRERRVKVDAETPVPHD